MFLLPKTLQKAKHRSIMGNASLPHDEILPQPAVVNPGHLHNGPPAYPLLTHSRVLVENTTSDPQKVTDNANFKIITDPTSPAVIEETPVAQSALMSNQSPTAKGPNSPLLSPCSSDLPPLPETQAPKHMTDPSPFSACIPKQRPPENIDVHLRVGGHLTLEVGGRKITGKVMEIHPIDGSAAPPEWRTSEVTNPEPVPRSTNIAEEWNLDNCMPSIHNQGDIQPARYPTKVIKTPDHYVKKQIPASSADENVANNQKAQEGGAQTGVHCFTHLTQNPDQSQATCSTREPIQWDPNDIITIMKWQSTGIDLKRAYQCGGVLGKGSFGKVYLVLRTADKRQFAMKTHDFRHRIRVRNAKALLKELAIQKLVTRLEFASSLVDIWYSSAKFLHVITEYCPGGDLLRHVGKLTDKQMFLVVAELILGLVSLHEKGIIHQDIKPDNVLIDVAGHCVITDFGLSNIANVQSGLLVSRKNPPGGTPEYTAPEIKLHSARDQMFYWDHSADYWSLGATIFHLQTGSLITPFANQGWERNLESPMVQEIMTKHRTPSTLITLVQKFTRFDRTRRWKGPRVKEADYFHALNSSPTGWYEIYAKKYPPFRFRYPLPVNEDVPSEVPGHLDPRARPGEEGADLNNLIEALKTYEVTARLDDCLMPQHGDFIPRAFPDH